MFSILYIQQWCETNTFMMSFQFVTTRLYGIEIDYDDELMLRNYAFYASGYGILKMRKPRIWTKSTESKNMLSYAFASFFKKIVSLYYCPAQRAQAQSSIYLYLYFTSLYLYSTLFMQKYTYYSRIFSLSHHFLSLLLIFTLSTRIKYLHRILFIISKKLASSHALYTCNETFFILSWI